MSRRSLVSVVLVAVLAGCAKSPPAVPATSGMASPTATTQQPTQDAASMTDADKDSIAATAPPSASTVLYMIYNVDGDGATEYEIENRSVAAYWYGHAFALGGKRYFTGFAYNTPEHFEKDGDDVVPAPASLVTLTQATFVLAAPGTDKAWSFDGAELFIGEFGGYEKADPVDTARKAISREIAGTRLLLAVPTARFETGITTQAYALFLFDPAPPKGVDDTHWTYLGSAVTGEENSAACDDGQVMTCYANSGVMRIGDAAGDALPTISVAMTGTTRTLDASDEVAYTFDATAKRYEARPAR